MPDQKLSLEEILDEYSPDEAGTPHVDREDAQKILAGADDPPPAPGAAPETRPPVSHEKKALFDGEPADPEVSGETSPMQQPAKRSVLVSSDGVKEMEAPREEITVPAEEPTPMIRPMADSTRAKEAERMKKSRKKRKKHRSSGYTYKQEAAVGEYVYNTPKTKEKKQKRQPETEKNVKSVPTKKVKLENITDIVPVPSEDDMRAIAELEAITENAPRADMTGISMPSGSSISEFNMDIRIGQPEEPETETGNPRKKDKKQRTKRIVDFNYYGDVEDVGRDIRDLTSIISTRVVILALASFLSIYITLCSQFELPIVNLLTMKHIGIYMGAQLLLGLISALASLPVITKGLKNLFTLKADSDSMTAVTAVTCIIAMIPAFIRPDLAQREFIRIYMPVGILAMLTNALGKLLIMIRAKRNFSFVSREYDRHAVVFVRDEERAERLTRGALGDFPILAAMRRTNFITDFLRYSYSSDITDSYCRRSAPLCLIFSAAMSVVLTILRTGTLFTSESAAFGSSVFSLLICASSCAAMPFVANVPLENASSAALRNKGIILGYQSVDDLYDANSMLITSDKLFPAGTVRLDDIKLFSNTKLEEALQMSSSLAKRAGSIMSDIFTHPDSRDGSVYDIENFSYEDGLGICGWINNKRVLLGSRDHMTNHSIEGVPSKSKEAEYIGDSSEALYLSISGNVAALFTVTLRPDRNIKRWFKRLIRSKISVVVKTVDPCVTGTRLSSLMGVPEDMIRVLPKRLHEDFDAETKRAVRMSASLACSGKFTSMAQLLIGIKGVHSSAVAGLIVQTISILLGLGLSILLIFSKAFAVRYIYMSAAAIIIYNLFFLVLTYLIVSLKKS